MMSPMERAEDIINRCCDDPEMWATHGMPGELKLRKLTVMIAEAITAAQVEVSLRKQ